MIPSLKKYRDAIKLGTPIYLYDSGLQDAKLIERIKRDNNLEKLEVTHAPNATGVAYYAGQFFSYETTYSGVVSFKGYLKSFEEALQEARIIYEDNCYWREILEENS